MQINGKYYYLLVIRMIILFFVIITTENHMSVLVGIGVLRKVGQSCFLPHPNFPNFNFKITNFSHFTFSRHHRMGYSCRLWPHTPPRSLVVWRPSTASSLTSIPSSGAEPLTVGLHTPRRTVSAAGLPAIRRTVQAADLPALRS